MFEDRTNLALILDHVGDGVTAQDASGRLVYANATAARSLGFGSPAELLAAPLTEILDPFTLLDEAGHPFSLARLPGRRALAGEAEPSVTVRFRVHATGEERWSIIRSAPVLDASGQVVFAVNVWQDATAQKRSEAAHRFLAEAGEALATSLDVEATLTNIAQLAVPRLADWCAVSLVREDGSVSQLAVVHVDPERVAWARRLQEQYPADPEAEGGAAQVMRTGQPLLVPEVTDEMLVAAARDPEQLAILRRVGLSSFIIVPMIGRERALGAISFATAESGHRYDQRDLELAQELARRAALAVENAHLYDAERDARRLAEEARARFRTLFEGVPDAILVIDAGGRCIEANTAAGHLLDYTLDDLLTITVAEVFPDHQVTQAHFGTNPDPEQERAETEVRRRDQSLVPVEIWTRRLDLPAGPIALAVIRDISSRIADDAIREEVLSTISHDLRNPLGSIKLHAQGLTRLLRRGGPYDPERIGASLTAIDSLSTRATYLLDDIVDVARGRGGEAIPFAPQATDLVALVHRCAVEAGSAAGRQIQVQCAVAAIVARWDPHGIERVVLNLLNNALKYSPEGGDVVVRTELAGDDRDQAVVIVTDEGIGVPAADLPRIFERYRRGRNVGQINGTGLGLTGAKQIVERHGGTITLSSTEGSGTEVTVRLPVVPPG